MKNAAKQIKYLPAKAKIIMIIALTTFAIFGFVGGAVYVVANNSQEREDICEQVQRVRDDVVSALDVLTSSSSDQGKVDAARKLIGNPNCPGD